MKTGIVMELRDGAAVVLQPDGAFVRQAARPEWQVGDTVAVRTPKKGKAVWFRWFAVAACLVVLAAAAFGGYNLLYATSSVISIDLNPSIELELNRLGRVVDLTAYNDEGGDLLAGLALKGKTYEQGAAVAAHHPQLQVHCNGVGHAVVELAHEHGVTPGKMRAILELQQLDPTVEIDDYSDCSMGELRRLIRKHGGSGGEGQGDGSCDAGSTSGGQQGAGGGNGYGNGNGNGGGGQGNGQGNGTGQGRHGASGSSGSAGHGSGQGMHE